MGWVEWLEGLVGPGKGLGGAFLRLKAHEPRLVPDRLRAGRERAEVAGMDDFQDQVRKSKKILPLLMLTAGFRLHDPIVGP